jgi:hypothetical protein
MARRLKVPLFGLSETDVDTVAERLSSVLGIAFDRRESSYLGEYSLYRGEQNSEVRIYLNKDPMHNPEEGPEEEQFFEREFRSFRVLLDAKVPSELLSRLQASITALFPGATLIRET